MSTFHYTTPPSLIFGRGTVKNIGQVLKQRFNVTRFLVISDQGLQKNGLTAGVLKSLGKAGLDYQVFDAISSDPLEEEVQKGTQVALDYAADGIIGFGGGSPMDAAKAIAILAGTGRPIADLYGQDKGGLHHIHHGLSNALLLPPVLRFNAKAAAAQYGELADLVMPAVSGGADKKTSAFIDALEAMIADSSLETRLSQVGINHNHIPSLAIEAMKLDRLLKNNPRKIILKDSLEIYQSIL